MQLSQVLLTVVLVAAGIFVYDVVRSPDGNGGAAGDPVVVHAPTPDTSEEPPPLRLEGRGEAYWRAEVERRLEELELEEKAVAAARAGILTDAEREERADAALEELPPELVVLLERQTGGRFEPGDVAAFRALLEHVEEQRQDEQVARGVARFLDRLDLGLSDEQRRQVMAATAALRDKAETLWRGNETLSREERRESFQQLRTEFETEVSKYVASADAEKIVGGLVRVALGGGRSSGGGPGGARVPGGGSRRGGGGDGTGGPRPR